MGLLFTGNTILSCFWRSSSPQRREAANQSGWFFWVGTAVQKIMYFLKNAGVPMGYRFSIYHYGPFCDEILRDTDLLLADGVIADRSPQTTKYSDYTSGESIQELLRDHEDAIRPWQDIITHVINELAPFNPDRLEATATLDYIYRQQLATGQCQPTQRVLSRNSCS